jgi:hypothetical protein
VGFKGHVVSKCLADSTQLVGSLNRYVIVHFMFSCSQELWISDKPLKDCISGEACIAAAGGNTDIAG